MRKKRMMAILLAGAMVMSTLAGCGSKETAATETPAASGQAAEQSAAETGETPASEKKDDGEIVELSFYMSNGPVIDQERIMGPLPFSSWS